MNHHESQSSSEQSANSLIVIPSPTTNNSFPQKSILKSNHKPPIFITQKTLKEKRQNQLVHKSSTMKAINWVTAWCCNSVTTKKANCVAFYLFPSVSFCCFINKKLLCMFNDIESMTFDNWNWIYFCYIEARLADDGNILKRKFFSMTIASIKAMCREAISHRLLER